VVCVVVSGSQRVQARAPVAPMLTSLLRKASMMLTKQSRILTFCFD
jgi:hypothetical protein